MLRGVTDVDTLGVSNVSFQKVVRSKFWADSNEKLAAALDDSEPEKVLVALDQRFVALDASPLRNGILGRRSLNLKVFTRGPFKPMV